MGEGCTPFLRASPTSAKLQLFKTNLRCLVCSWNVFLNQQKQPGLFKKRVQSKACRHRPWKQKKPTAHIASTGAVLLPPRRRARLAPGSSITSPAAPPYGSPGGYCEGRRTGQAGLMWAEHSRVCCAAPRGEVNHTSACSPGSRRKKSSNVREATSSDSAAAPKVWSQV